MRTAASPIRSGAAQSQCLESNISIEVTWLVICAVKCLLNELYMLMCSAISSVWLQTMCQNIRDKGVSSQKSQVQMLFLCSRTGGTDSTYLLNCRLWKAVRMLLFSGFWETEISCTFILNIMWFFLCTEFHLDYTSLPRKPWCRHMHSGEKKGNLCFFVSLYLKLICSS